MSAGRKHRRAVARHRAVAALESADQAPAEFVGDLGPFELWARGPVMFAVGRPAPGMPEELAAAITMMNTATITGTCPGCGVRRGHRHLRARPGHEGVSAFPHGPGCPAGEADEIAARAGWERR